MLENNKGLKFVVVKEFSYKKILVRFVDTGFECFATKQQIENGSVKDKINPSVYGVGFVGDGKYKTSQGGANTPEYIKWIQMLRRCYSKSRTKRNESYENCEVDSVWHNFQNFAEWYVNNHPKDGKRYDLDKDMKSKGKKIYSPQTCSFISTEENLILAKKGSLDILYKISRNGVLYEFSNINKASRELGLDPGNLSRLLSGKSKSHKGYIKVG